MKYFTEMVKTQSPPLFRIEMEFVHGYGEVYKDVSFVFLPEVQEKIAEHGIDLEQVVAEIFDFLQGLISSKKYREEAEKLFADFLKVRFGLTETNWPPDLIYGGTVKAHLEEVHAFFGTNPLKRRKV